MSNNAYFDERYRQECLSHMYKEVTRPSKSPVKGSDRNGGNIRFDHSDVNTNIRTNDSAVLKPAPGSVYSTLHNSEVYQQALSARVQKPLGVSTGYGLPEKGPYDPFTGKSASPRAYCNGTGGHIRRLPVDLLSPAEQAVALAGSPKARSPSPTRAGIRGPRGESEAHYIDLSYAMRPPCHTPRSPLKDRPAIHSTFGSLSADRTKHVRNTLSPNDLATKPLTSSQEVGWHTADTYRESIRYPRVMCNETRYAESLALGPRNAAGHLGQGAARI